jgi:hypothetical protein
MLPETRLLAAVICPVLIVAFCVLYPVPSDTDSLFAWEIEPTLTPMVLAAAYLGGAYFFLRAWQTSSWHTVKVGFVAVCLFASALGLATIIHWDKFNHSHIAFWLWAGLYFTTPFAVLTVLLRNRAVEGPADPHELRLSPAVRALMGLTGVSSVCLGLFLYLAPSSAQDVWPWELTDLTARVVGAVFLLGVAGVGVYLDPRWSTTRLILRVECVMVALILVAAVRAHDQLDSSRPLTWVLGIGLTSVLLGSAVLDRSMERRAA